MSGRVGFDEALELLLGDFVDGEGDVAAGALRLLRAAGVRAELGEHDVPEPACESQYEGFHS